MIKKHIISLLALLFILVACEKPKPEQKEILIEEPIPIEVIEPVEDPIEQELPKKEITDTALGFLVTYENKYAKQEKLFENEILANRLKGLERFNYDKLLYFWNTETPIVIIDNIAHMSGCKVDDCPSNAYDFFIDLTNDNINIYHFRSNMLRLYQEKGMIDLPQAFAAEMEIKKSNAKIGEVDDTESTYSLTND
jgi:hypothetical protein